MENTFFFSLEHSFFFNWIVGNGQGAIKQLVSYFESHVRITQYIVIPQFAGIRGDVEIAVINCAPNRHGVRQQKRGLGLNLDLLNLVRERPVGDWGSDEFPPKPKTWQPA